jgi:nucleotide-binding universal stress UspA family protein
MTMQILVPLDGSPFSEQAIPQAFRLAQFARGTVHLVRVLLPTPALELIAIPDERLTADERRAAQGYLEELAAKAPQGVSAHAAVLTGPVVTALSNYIAEANMEMVVMTTHGRTGLTRTFLGSVADELTRSVKVPLLLLRPYMGDDGLNVDPLYARRILIPLDGSQLAEQALDRAVEVGGLTGARYTLLQVVPPPVLSTYPDTVETQTAREHEHAIDCAHEYLETVADRLRMVGLRVETEVTTHDDIAAGIVQEAIADSADMIVMATHGRSGWKRLTLGSVAQEVLHTAWLPLLVVRGSEAAVPAA